MDKFYFPEDFRFGVVTSAYQIEGAYNEDGKGLNIWDKFCKVPQKIANGDVGDTACDHYHRYKEDIKLMHDLGIKNYRFSISWTRIYPDGFGKINESGIKFYCELVDELIRNGITPMVTLYHWDLPQKLQEMGGWANREICSFFEAYADTTFKVLGDRVPFWITINEPSSIVAGGYMAGTHAPGEVNMKKALNAGENLLIAHGLAVRRYKKRNLKGKIGIALNEIYYEPDPDSKGAKMAVSMLDGLGNKFFLDVLFRGKYPRAISVFLSLFGLTKGLSKREFEITKTPMDFIGLNYYTRQVVKSWKLFNNPDIKNIINEKHITDMNWEIYPEGLYKLLMELKEYTSIPIYITENGAAFKDKIEDNKVHDNDRIEYIKKHFSSAEKAIKSGVNLKGYYLWSLLDNFEWTYGYSKRFGLVYIDFKTQERILKDSALWYSKFLKNPKGL